MKEFARTRPLQAAQEAFARLNSAQQPTLESIFADVARVTGKRIKVRTIPSLAGDAATGLWFERPSRHLIFQAPPVSIHHSRFVQIHEVGHITFAWLGWAPPPPLSQVDPATLTTEELIAAAHGHRIDLSGPLEKAAEYFARVATWALRNGLDTRRRGYNEELS